MSRIPPLPEPVFLWDRPEYPHFTADQLRARDRQIVEACIAEIPATWLDPLLTGKGGMGQPPYSCHDIERLLTKLQDRLRSLLGEGEGKHG